MNESIRITIVFHDSSTDVVENIASYQSASNMSGAYLAMPRVKSVEINVSLVKDGD